MKNDQGLGRSGAALVDGFGNRGYGGPAFRLRRCRADRVDTASGLAQGWVPAPLAPSEVMKTLPMNATLASTATATTAPLEMNSLDWWNDYFQNHWSPNNGSAQTAHFMIRLIDSLPEPERRHLSEPGREILDWGCAFGEGTSLLARTFPHARVSGLDFSENAIDEARKRHPGVEYLHSRTGIPREFDAIVTSNCLEHFDDPYTLAAEHMASCRDLYIILVPYEERELCPYHKVRFDDSSFPATLGPMTLVETRIVEVDKTYWGDGKQLLAIYGSPRYLAKRARMASMSSTEAIQKRIESERAKWNDYYASLDQDQALESPEIAAFNAELCGLLGSLVPDGARILEAGCGAGLQSLAIARTRRYAVSLLDFSERAIDHARRRFAGEGLTAQFAIGDVFQRGSPDHDLVFNAGVLEHYSLAEQTAFLKGMASRSRNYVLVLVPNRLCYWYWIWRIYAVHRSAWPFGKESPLTDLSEAFEKAGLEFVGQTFLGADWAESFIECTPGLAPELRSIILESHRSPLIPSASKSYLLAALGRVPGAPRPSEPDDASIWRTWDIREPVQVAETLASFSDALALKIAADAKVVERDGELFRQRSSRRLLEQELTERRAESERLQAESERLRAEVEGLRAETQRIPELERDLEDRMAAELVIATIRRSLGEHEPSKTSGENNEVWPDAEQAQRWSQALIRRHEDLQRLRRDLQEIMASRSWRMSVAVRKLRRVAFPHGTFREKAARKAWRGLRAARRAWRS